jgi:hypothetical protein
VKIRPGSYEVDTLLAVLTYLADHEDMRRQMGENGRQFIGEHHDVKKVARQYLAFFDEVISSPNTEPPSASSWDDRLVRETAAILAHWGVTEYDDGLLRPIAAAIAGLSFLS